MFDIDRKLVKVRAVTNVPEFKGEKREHACNVKFEFTTDNTVLDHFDVQLRKAFYEKDNGKAKANANGQQELSLPREDLDLTSRRLVGVQMPLKVKKEMAGYELIYHCGASEESFIKLGDVGLSDFSLDLQDGGSVLVVFSAYSKPTADVQGRIDHMAQTEIEITLRPPSVKQADLVDEASKASKGSKKKEKKSEDPFVDSDEQNGRAEENDEGESSLLGDPPIVDPFHGTELARGTVKSDAKVEVKKSRRVAAAE